MTSRILALAALLIGTVAASAAVPPPLTVEYSADRRIASDDRTIDGRVVAAPGMERSELAVGGMSAVMILRSDRKLGWMLMPAQRLYQEMDFAQAAQQSGNVAADQMELENRGQRDHRRPCDHQVQVRQQGPHLRRLPLVLGRWHPP